MQATYSRTSHGTRMGDKPKRGIKRRNDAILGIQTRNRRENAVKRHVLASLHPFFRLATHIYTYTHTHISFIYILHGMDAYMNEG
mmetsp:Transcript_12605/g.19179  ORF Transcript_12605/g.19179 Transcript_12605/m.19179 type:complete len:85 (+) Transcript_12605:348-602(+)